MINLFRFHRGSLAEAMKTTLEFSDKTDLLKKINSQSISEYESITIKPYSGVDKRNGWDTYIVSCRGCILGFTNCMVK